MHESTRAPRELVATLAPLAATAGLVLVAGAGCRSASGEPSAEPREVFLAACARCHGVEGGGGAPLSAGGPRPRNFRDATFQASRTDAQLVATVRSGTGTGMPAFAGILTDAQIAAAVQHVRGFRPGAPDR